MPESGAAAHIPAECLILRSTCPFRLRVHKVAWVYMKLSFMAAASGGRAQAAAQLGREPLVSPRADVPALPDALGSRRHSGRCDPHTGSLGPWPHPEIRSQQVCSDTDQPWCVLWGLRGPCCLSIHLQPCRFARCILDCEGIHNTAPAHSGCILRQSEDHAGHMIDAQ